MKEENYKKILKADKKLVIWMIILIFVSGLLFYFGSKFDKTDKLTATDYNYLIANYQDEDEDYVKVTITDIPYIFAYKGNYNYYFVYDEYDYAYIARLTDDTYNMLEKKYDNGEDINYELVGYTYKIESDVLDIAIETYNDWAKQTIIDESNYRDYFGTTYLDETVKPSDNMEALLIILGAISSICVIVLMICYIISVINVKRMIKKYGREDLEYELGKSSTKSYKKAGIYLTEKYIISTFAGLRVLKYDELIWIYNQKRRYNFVSMGNYLLGIGKNKKTYQIAYCYKDINMLSEIMHDINTKNPDILIGYTKENKAKYKEIIKDIKKQKQTQN